MPRLAANARMYAVTPAVEAAWRALFGWAAGRAGVGLHYAEHPAPAPLEELWSRPDLGLAFMCGYPFATGGYAVAPVAAPLPAAERAEGRAVYWSDLVTRADGPVGGVGEARRIGWTVEHSQSGFHAPRRFLLERRASGEAPFTGHWVGPLVTPRRVIEALVAGEIDLGPLDSYWHDLLRVYEPGTAARLRTVASTSPTPMPLLVASAQVPPGSLERLGAALLGAGQDPEAAPLLDRLRLRGFAPVAPESYAVLLTEDEVSTGAPGSRRLTAAPGPSA